MKKRKVTKILLIVGLIFAVAVVGFLIYAADYHHADSDALAALSGDPTIISQDNLTILPQEGADTALIFYPGAKVQDVSYLPILEKIRSECKITCILVKMPLNMAIFDPGVANGVIAKFPEIKSWYIGGHSMGGAMASDYASKNPDKVKGLILLGAYIYGDYPPENALTIYGTLNSDLEKHIDYTENIVVIQGGNHAQFGNYGKQKGDPDAEITAQEQQDIAVCAIKEFLLQKEG
ncbi:MAG: alpha/beta fold hydrolase [Christensenella sp.]|nr:alpha/beta fold hydrolase [Christensenella sp.]